MKPMKPILFVFLTVFLALFSSATASAQSGDAKTTKPAAPADAPGLKSKLFEVKHRDTAALGDALRGLSSSHGSVIYNVQLRILTVRDFPENLAVIEDALKRLDVPEAASGNLEVTLHLLKGTKAATDATTFPASLQPVLKQLQGTLKFSGYQFISTFSNRTQDGNPLEGNGVVIYAVAGEPSQKTDDKSSLRYKIARVRTVTDSDGKEVFQLTNFNFMLAVPVNSSYRDTGFNTSLSLREGEQVVVGTTNLGEEAVIVVVSVKKVK